MTKILTLLITSLIFCSCGNTDSNNESPSAYDKMHTTFTGHPDKSDLQPQLEAIMERYNIPVTDDNLLKVANMLFVLKQESKIGVTEIQILKHIYQNGDPNLTIDQQAALSASILERTN